MLELMYPERPAPEVPASRVFRMQNKGTAKDEMLPVVDRCGRVIGQAARSYVHVGVKVLHPVVHLHIINHKGEIFLQKRSMTKKLLPGRWDTAVGGHISYGESVWESLSRESWEELGLTDFNPVFLEDYVFESDIEQELVCAFAAVGDFNIAPCNDEVTEGRFWPVSEIIDNLGKSVFTPNFESEFQRFGKTLESLL